MLLLTIIPGIGSSEASRELQQHTASDPHDEIEGLDNALLRQSRRHGDLNNDGEVDHEDIEILKDYLEGKRDLTEEQRRGSDLNQDGVVDEKDLRLLYLFIQRREVEGRVRELQDLYSSLCGNQTSGHVVLGVDNGNIESVKSELDSATALLATLSSF